MKAQRFALVSLVFMSFLAHADPLVTSDAPKFSRAKKLELETAIRKSWKDPIESSTYDHLLPGEKREQERLENRNVYYFHETTRDWAESKQKTKEAEREKLNPPVAKPDNSEMIMATLDPTLRAYVPISEDDISNNLHRFNDTAKGLRLEFMNKVPQLERQAKRGSIERDYYNLMLRKKILERKQGVDIDLGGLDARLTKAALLGLAHQTCIDSFTKANSWYVGNNISKLNRLEKDSGVALNHDVKICMTNEEIQNAIAASDALRLVKRDLERIKNGANQESIFGVNHVYDAWKSISKILDSESKMWSNLWSGDQIFDVRRLIINRLQTRYNDDVNRPRRGNIYSLNNAIQFTDSLIKVLDEGIIEAAPPKHQDRVREVLTAE